MSGPPPKADAGSRLSAAQRLNWLRLIRSENVGPATFRDLLRHFGSALAALDALPDFAPRMGKPIRVASVAEAEAELESLAALGARLVTIGDPDYPQWLRAIDAAPPLLAMRGGDAALMERPMIALVGARNASVAGRKMASIIARDLGGADFVIASGLARGIDAAAHEAALTSGTIAAFAGGIDRVYPPEHAALAERILAAGGALISEMPFGWEPRARDFPRRNRLVSGMAAGVVVVEAALRSGSLITARLAGQQGRVVCAVPGSPLDPRAAGSNGLIKEGAHLVTDGRDVIDVVGPMLGRVIAPPPAWSEDEPSDTEERPTPGDDERAVLIEALGPVPTSIDDIIRFTGLHASVVQTLLLKLELTGRLARHAGQRVSLIDSL